MDHASRRFFNKSAPAGASKRKKNDDDNAATGTASYSGLTHYDRSGTYHRPEPGNKNRDLIGKIDDGNDIISHNIGRLQTVLDRRSEKTNIATTGQVLSNVGSFINSVRGSNPRLSKRAENVGDQLLDQLISQAGLSNMKSI